MFQFFKKIFSNRHTPEERQKLAEKDTLEYQKIHESDKHPAIKHFLKSIHLTKWLVKLFIPDFLVGHPSLFDNLKIIHQEPKFKPMRMAMGAFFIFLFLFQFGLAIFNIITAPKMHADAIHWPLTTATDYSYDNTKINISGGFANLITKDQTDNDNTASGFGGGTYSNTQWYATSTWVGLPTATATGDFTSRIMDVGGDVAWSTINWTTALPNYKELPNNAATETAYSLSNANMSGNVLLTHMNESSGAINDTSGNSNNGTNNNATYSSTGRFNTALNFNGTTSNVSIPDASSLNMSAAFTAEAWVKFGSTFNSSSGANMGLLDKGAYQLFFDKNDGKLKFSLTANATSTWTLNYNGGCSIVRSMAVYNNKLYAGMSGVAGCNDVYSFDGVNWTISYDGAGPASSFTALAVYNGKLYAGQGGSAGYNDVYSFDGTTWTLAFDSPQTLATGISALAVYNNKLYIGQGFNSPYGDVYVYDGATWSLSYNGTSLSIWSFAVYNNKLYAGRGNGAAGDDDVLVFDGTSWSVNYNGWTSLNVMALATYNGKLYAGLGTAANAGDVWEYNGTTWSISYDSANTAIPSLVVYNGKLYAGQQGATGLGDILSFDGTSWTVAHDGVQEAFFSLADYNGKLYGGQGTGAGDSDIYVYGNATKTSITSWDTNWHHVAATYNGTKMSMYVDGIWDVTTATTTFAINADTRPLLIGKTYDTVNFGGGTNEYFNGNIDEVAIYNRALSGTEILDHYKRGVVRLKYQVRSCNDNACAGESFIGPDGTAGTYYSEETNSTIGLPSLTLTNVINNRYFQYKAFFETDSVTYYPGLKSVSFGPSHYDAGAPTIANLNGEGYSSISAFDPTAGPSNAGTLNYQISNNGTNWYYWNGSHWVTQTGAGYPTQTNDSATISTNITQFTSDVGTGSFYFKAFLASNLGVNQVELDQLDITHVDPIIECTSWIYSAWGTCDGTTQARTIASSSPANCTGGAPVLNQACTLPCTDFNYSAWAGCDGTTETRTVLSTIPATCTGGATATTSQACTLPCTDFTYSAWAGCDGTTETRTVATTSPMVCTGGLTPTLSQSCSFPCTSWTYSAWDTCDGLDEDRTILTSNPPGCTGGSPDLSQACTLACTDFNYTAWSVCDGANQTRTVASTIPAICMGGATPNLIQACTLPAAPAAPAVSSSNNDNPTYSGGMPIWLIPQQKIAEAVHTIFHALTPETTSRSMEQKTEQPLVIIKEKKATAPKEAISPAIAINSNIAITPMHEEVNPIVMAEPIVAPIPEITLATTTNPIASDTPEMITAIAIVQTTPQIKPIIIIPTQVSGIIKARVGEKLIIKKADLATSQKDTIQAVTNKPIQLTVEMNQPINRLKGSIIFKTKKIEPVAREFSLKTFLASLFSTKLAWADLVNTDNAIIVSEFNYINNGDGAYSANIETPDVAGTYDLITKVNFVDPNIPAEDIKVTASVDQAGSVYSKINNEEFHVSMAKVSLFKLNEINNKYELWGGIKDFQVNPQVTAGDGTYAFFPPTGTYYLQVEAPYYSDYQSKTFQVNTGEVVSQKIELKRGFWQHIQALLYKR